MQPRPQPLHPPGPPSASPPFLLFPLSPAPFPQAALSAPLPVYAPQHPLHSPHPPRPRLKRSHASTDTRTLPPASTGDHPSPAPLAQPSPGSDSWNQHVRGRSAASTLDPIKEWPAAEADAPPAVAAGLGLDFGPGAQPLDPPDDDDERAGRRSKRRRVAPDHEAFERLSLASPAGATAFSPAACAPLPLPPQHAIYTNPQPFAPPRPPPPRSSFTLESSTFHPAPPPSSPTFHAPSLPAAPPTSPVTQHAATPTPSGPATGGAGGLPTVPWGQSAFFASPPAATGADRVEGEGEGEVTMLPAHGSVDLDPHRIYIASLSPSPSPPSSPPPSSFPFPTAEVALNPVAARALAEGESGLPPALLANLRREADRAQRGEVILYRPPASSRALEEGAKERALRERKERREEGWREFEVAREREEALQDAVGVTGIGDGDDGMDVEMEM